MIVKGCEVQTSEDNKVTRVSNCRTNVENFMSNIEGQFPETTSLNFRPNTSVVSILPSTIFTKFPKIESLVMNAVGLEEIRHGSFLDANHLKILSLERNILTRFDEETFKGATNLETIKLGRNNISSIDKQAFNGLQTLKVLDLSRNDLQMIEEGIFQGLTSLEVIDFSFNHLETLPKLLFTSSPNIKVIKLFKNHLQTFDINLQADRNFCYLNIDNNSINYFSLTFIQLTATADDDTCTSHGIHASNNEIEYFYVTKESMAVNLIALNGNRLNNIENLTQIMALTKVDLSNNPLLTEEALKDLKHAKNIRGLSLKGINLTRLDKRTLGTLKNLSELDVSNNSLETIDFMVFADGLKDFYKLNLANNRITTIDVDKLLEKFPNISYLNIKGNLLTRSHLNSIVSTLNRKNVTVMQ